MPAKPATPPAPCSACATLRSSLAAIAADKQALAAQLQRCQRSNASLSLELRTARQTLTEHLQRLQQQVAAIHEQVAATSCDLVASNRQLHSTLCSTARTVRRLALMFLSMRESRRLARRTGRQFERLAHSLADTIRQQAHLLAGTATTTTTTTDGANQHPSDVEHSAAALQHRVAVLLQQNAELRTRLCRRNRPSLRICSSATVRKVLLRTARPSQRTKRDA